MYCEAKPRSALKQGKGASKAHLVGTDVALIVLNLTIKTKVASSRVEVRGDEVESDSALGEMVEGREAAGEGVRSVCEGAYKSAATTRVHLEREACRR